MLNVIALRPVEKIQPEEESAKLPSIAPRHHVLKRLSQENSGRLDCGDDLDIEVPSLQIYAAR